MPFFSPLYTVPHRAVSSLVCMLLPCRGGGYVSVWTELEKQIKAGSQIVPGLLVSPFQKPRHFSWEESQSLLQADLCSNTRSGFGSRPANPPLCPKWPTGPSNNHQHRKPSAENSIGNQYRNH